MSQSVRVWDLPTRVFHWALVAFGLISVVTGYIGGALIEWHARSGLAVLALLLFRLVWGLVGGHWSRFGRFLYSPRATWAYLKGSRDPDHLVGHNPLGALSVWALLLVLLAQVGSGLISDDEISFTGPLNRWVSSRWSLAATWYHKEVGQWLLIGLVVLHVVAVMYYLWVKKDNLVRPMFRGDKMVATPVPSSRDDLRSRLLGAAILAVSAAVAAWVAGLGNP
jgi:cytochrome b